MTDLKLQAGIARHQWYARCEQHRRDENAYFILCALGCILAAVLLFVLASVVVSVAGNGCPLLGVPALGVARVAWGRRGR